MFSDWRSLAVLLLRGCDVCSPTHRLDLFHYHNNINVNVAYTYNTLLLNVNSFKLFLIFFLYNSMDCTTRWAMNGLHLCVWVRWTRTLKWKQRTQKFGSSSQSYFFFAIVFFSVCSNFRTLLFLTPFNTDFLFLFAEFLFRLLFFYSVTRNEYVISVKRQILMNGWMLKQKQKQLQRCGPVQLKSSDGKFSTAVERFIMFCLKLPNFVHVQCTEINYFDMVSIVFGNF